MIRVSSVFTILSFIFQTVFLFPITVYASTDFTVQVKVKFTTKKIASQEVTQETISKDIYYQVPVDTFSFDLKDTAGNTIDSYSSPSSTTLPIEKTYNLKAFENYILSWKVLGKEFSKVIKVRREQQEFTINVQTPVEWKVNFYTYENNQKVPYIASACFYFSNDKITAYKCSPETETPHTFKLMPDIYDIYVSSSDFEKKVLDNFTVSERTSNLTVNKFAPSTITLYFEKPLKKDAKVTIYNYGEQYITTVPQGEVRYTFETPQYFYGTHTIIVEFGNGNIYKRDYYIKPGSKRLITIHEDYDYKKIAEKYDWDEDIPLTLCSTYPGVKKISLFSNSMWNSELYYLSDEVPIWKGEILPDFACVTTDPLSKGVYYARVEVPDLGIVESKTINSLSGTKQFSLDNPTRNKYINNITVNVKEIIGFNNNNNNQNCEPYWNEESQSWINNNCTNDSLITQDINNFTIIATNLETGDRTETHSNYLGLVAGKYKIVVLSDGFLPAEKEVRVYNSTNVNFYLSRVNQYRDVIISVLIDKDSEVTIKNINATLNTILAKEKNPETNKWDVSSSPLLLSGAGFQKDVQSNNKEKWKATTSLPVNKKLTLNIFLEAYTKNIDFTYKTNLRVKVSPESQPSDNIYYDETTKTWINVPNTNQTPEFIIPIHITGKLYSIKKGTRDYNNSMSLEDDYRVKITKLQFSGCRYQEANIISSSSTDEQFWLPDDCYVDINFTLPQSDANLFRPATNYEIELYNYKDSDKLITDVSYIETHKKFKTPIPFNPDDPNQTFLKNFACKEDPNKLCTIWISATRSSQHKIWLEFKPYLVITNLPDNKKVTIVEDSYYFSEFNARPSTKWRDTAYNILQGAKLFCVIENGLQICQTSGERYIGIPVMNDLNINAKYRLQICDKDDDTGKSCITRVYTTSETVKVDDTKVVLKNPSMPEKMPIGYSRYNANSRYAYANVSISIDYSKIGNEKYERKNVENKYTINFIPPTLVPKLNICNPGTAMHEYFVEDCPEEYTKVGEVTNTYSTSKIGDYTYYIVVNSTESYYNTEQARYSVHQCNPDNPHNPITVNTISFPHFSGTDANYKDAIKEVMDFCSKSPTFTASDNCGSRTVTICTTNYLPVHTYSLLSKGSITKRATKKTTVSGQTYQQFNPSHIQDAAGEIKVTVNISSQNAEPFPTSILVYDLNDPTKTVRRYASVEIKTDTFTKRFLIKTNSLSNSYTKTYYVRGNSVQQITLISPKNKHVDYSFNTNNATFIIDPNEFLSAEDISQTNLRVKATTDRPGGFSGKKVYVSLNPSYLPTGRKITQDLSLDSYFWFGGEKFELPVDPKNPNSTEIVTIPVKASKGEQVNLLFYTSDSDYSFGNSVIIEYLKKKIQEIKQYTPQVKSFLYSLDSVVSSYEGAIEEAEKNGLIKQGDFTWIPKTVTITSEVQNVNAIIPFHGTSPTEPRTYQFTIKVRSNDGFRPDLFEVMSIFTIFFGGGWVSKLAKAKYGVLKDGLELLEKLKKPINELPSKVYSRHFVAEVNKSTGIIDIIDKQTGEILGLNRFEYRMTKYKTIVECLEKLEPIGHKLKSMLNITKITKQQFTTIVNKAFKSIGGLTKTLFTFALPGGGLAVSGMPTIFLRSADESHFYTPSPEGYSEILNIHTWITNYFNKPLEAKEVTMFIKAKPGRTITLKILAPAHTPYVEVITAPTDTSYFTRDITLHRRETFMDYSNIQTFFDTHPLFQEMFEEFTGTPELYPTNSERASDLIDYMSEALSDLVVNLSEDFNVLAITEED